MGSGASRRAKKKESAAGTGFTLDDAGGAHSASLRRRRRVLFGTSQQRQFERLPPSEQYDANQEEEGDPVFERFPDEAAIDAFRAKARGVQDPDGFLSERAVELLEMKLRTGSTLSKRIFRVAQAQYLPMALQQQPGGKSGKSGAPSRPDKLTCYELLALYSVLRVGSIEELLELLFCIFDVDGDDRVSAQDLEQVVGCFLELGDNTGLSGADLEEYNHVAAGKRTATVRRIAQRAIKQYGAKFYASDAAAEAAEAAAEAAEAAAEAEQAQGAAPLDDAAEGGRQSAKGRGDEGSDEDSDDDEKDSDAPSLGQASTEAAPDAKESKPRTKRSLFACGSKKLPKEDTPKKQPSSVERSASGAAKAPKPRPKRSSSCCGAKCSKGQPMLNFEQWRKWLLETRLLSEAFIGGVPAVADEDVESSDDRQPSSHALPSAGTASLAKYGTGSFGPDAHRPVALRGGGVDSDSD
mmetsp:Transcript_46012/g.127779  ORF Transcript_46012/g.127779 Transcript_46012/m.127779 type:complete len:467 (-) Transcript_46012:61-1461(-)